MNVLQGKSKVNLKIINSLKLRSDFISSMSFKSLFSNRRGFEEKFQNMHGLIQNIPVRDWLSLKKLKTSKKNGCSIYPDILNDVEYRNTYWQIFRFHGSTFHLYSAYLGKTLQCNKTIILYNFQTQLLNFKDNRTLVTNGPIIRILYETRDR